MSPRHDDPGGQHRVVGNALLGLGGVGIVAGTISAMLHLELRFLDAHALTIASLVLAVTGVWQRAAARKFARDAASLEAAPTAESPPASRPGR